MEQRDREAAFTLIEMSMVLLIVGIVIMIVFPALKAVRQSSQQSQTQTALANLLRSTAAFVQANGCLPCPTPASTVGNGFGHVRGQASRTACASCIIPEGIAPFASLGLPFHMARDGWGRWITMRIDPTLAINFGVVPPTSLCLSSDPPPCVTGASKKGLCQPTLTNVSRPSVLTQNGSRQQAAVIFVSHGANGYGAYHADPLANDGEDNHPAYQGPATACSDIGGYERCNADGDQNFVLGETIHDPIAPFDDQLVFLDRNSLVSYLGNPACQAEW
jgi:prepilin-type N-terminal cleavage/methylation domain-containing protein